MDTMNRRGFLHGVFGVATVAAVAAGAGATLISQVAEAAPVPSDKKLPEAMDDFIENVQHRHHHYHRHWHRHRRRRRRHWHCWWHRGRRVCGWRYW